MSLDLPVIQTRPVRAGECVGYGHAWTAPRDGRIATVAAGYADGIPRALSGAGLRLWAGDRACPVVGRVSMDLTCIDLAAAPELSEGDWIAADLVLPEVQAATGISQYEWLTQIGRRFDRIWVD